MMHALVSRDPPPQLRWSALRIRIQRMWDMAYLMADEELAAFNRNDDARERAWDHSVDQNEAPATPTPPTLGPGMAVTRKGDGKKWAGDDLFRDDDPSSIGGF